MKTTKKKAIESMYEPESRIYLESDMTDKIAGMEVGDEVEMKVKAKVTMIEEKEEGERCASLTIKKVS